MARRDARLRLLRDAVRRAEDIGVDIVFGYDHFHKPFVQRTSEGPRLLPEQPDVNNFEAWTALASWAEITRNVEIGTLVTGMGLELLPCSACSRRH